MDSGLPVLGDVRLCWTDIGVWGDRSCGELPRVGHCRHCEVYTARGNELLSRPAPADYLESWTQLLAAKKDAATTATTAYLVFRVGKSWLGMRAVALREIMPPAVVRSVPHRSSDILLGLTAVRGEIFPCVSLHTLIGDAPLDAAAPTVRFLVAQHGGAWVLPVDEVSGIHEVAEAGVEPMPATLAHTDSVYTMGIAQCGDRPVGLLDEELLFSAMERRVA